LNVLLTSVGRRADVVSSFRDALRGRGLVVAADSDPHAPALQFADLALVTPQASSPQFVTSVLRACRRHDISLVVPSLEQELPGLALAQDAFAAQQVVLVVASPAVVALCQDKVRAADFLRHLGVSSPTSYLTLTAALEALDAGLLHFPLVVKPRWGTTSLGLELVDDRADLQAVHGLLQRRLARDAYPGVASPALDQAVLVQPRLEGAEFGLDIVNDLSGRYVCTFAKQKLRMRAGQTDRAMTVHDEGLESLGRRIGTALGHVGLLDCDLISTRGGGKVLDLNPRIGGGYPFAHAAGADYPAALLAWAAGELPSPLCFTMTGNQVIAKADRHVEVPTALPHRVAADR
jgi:carbamoyl-phosphate synthase large subunit